MVFKNFDNIKLDERFWGDADPNSIIALLESCIKLFYRVLNRKSITNKKLVIANSQSNNPPFTSPKFFNLQNENIIILNTRDKFWSQYSYQFAHEFCHHIIGMPHPIIIDRFGWLEESLCELASIYFIDKMSETWKVAPPYKDWQPYSQDLHEYSREIKDHRENYIGEPFADWLQPKLPELYRDRYNRRYNTIIALNLLPSFKRHPQLWQTIQYFANVEVTATMTLEEFLKEWQSKLPSHLKGVLKRIERLFPTYN